MISSKPSKQRISLVNASLNQRRKLLAARLSDELISKYGIKRISVRVGDVVKIMRGDWVGHEGKVVKVDLKKGRIHVEGVTIKKADGTPIYYPIHPSKVVITKLDVSDKWREKVINRRKGV
ncbi:MAG: 50S ribosomal protein L24 [Sulfolobales archaeon]